MHFTGFMWRLESLFCRLCGEGPVFGRPFCGECDRRIRTELLKPSWRKEPALSVFSLIPWGGHNEKVVRALLYDLKESRSRRLFSYWAGQMISSLNPEFFSASLLVPVPSSTGRRHSLQLGEALSVLSGRPVKSLLTLTKADRQPGKGRRERQRRKLQRRKTRDLLSYKTVVLVDDVVTSAATLAAAREALGPSLHVVGLTLFSRELSA